MSEIPTAPAEMVTGIYNLPENQDRRYMTVDQHLVEAFPKVYIFSVDPEPHVVSKGGLGEFVIPAKPEGERVSPPLVIRGMHPEHMHMGTEVSPVNYVKGWDLARDIVGVNSQDKGLGRHTSDFQWYGVFITENETPTKKEIEAAEAKRHRYNLTLVADADRKYMSGKGIEIDARERAAAHEENLKKIWAEKPTAMEACPACGSAVLPNVAVCAHCNAVLNEEAARRFFPERFNVQAPETPSKAK